MIGIMRFGALGDIAASVPVLKAFNQNPTIITSQIGYELLKDEFNNFIILENKNIFSVLKLIKNIKNNISLLVDLQNNDRSKFIRFFCKNVNNKDVFLKQQVTKIFYDIAKKTHKIAPLDLNFSKKEKTYIILNAGSSPKHFAKRFDFDDWEKISRYLYEKFNLAFVLTGDKNDIEYVNELSRYIIGKKEITAGKTSLQELKNIVKNSFLTISTDSATMHISAAYKTPTIGIFKITNPIVSGPFGPWSDSVLYNKKHLINNLHNSLNNIKNYL